MKAVLFSTKAKKGHDDNVLEEKNVQGQFSSLPDITIQVAKAAHQDLE